MGNSYLRDLCEINKVEDKKIKGSKCVIDGHNWLYKYIVISAEYNDTRTFNINGNKKPELIGIPMGIAKLVEYNIEPVFVFDGGHEDLKKKELESRRKKKENAKEKQKKTSDKIEKAKLRARHQKVTKDTLDTTVDILDKMGINYMFSPKSAESQAAYMCRKEDSIQYVVSDDYDTIIFQSPFTLRNFTSSKGSEIISLEETLDSLELEYEQLVNAYIMCGTDYNDGVEGIGPVTSVKYVKEYESMEQIMDAKDFEIENYNEIYEIFTNPDVTDDYELPGTFDPDTKELEEYLPNKILENNNVSSSLEKIKEESKKSSLSDF